MPSPEEMRRVLDLRISGLDDIKDALIRSFTVSGMSGKKGKVICLVGPAGTGKSTLAREVANAAHKPFAQIRCGTITNALDVTGERDCYQDAKYGQIIENMRRLKTSDAVILLDEFGSIPPVNTMGKDGSAYNAFLSIFSEMCVSDVYLDGELDCSNTVFICTANSLTNIPAPVINRFDAVIHIPGYTDEQLETMARSYMLPELNEENHLQNGEISFTDAAIRRIISYIDDFGARRTGQYLKTVYEEIIYRKLNGKADYPVTVTPEMVDEILRKTVDLTSDRSFFRRHMKDYPKEIVDKIISIESELDVRDMEESKRHLLNERLHILVGIHPDHAGFNFDYKKYREVVDHTLYGMEPVKLEIGALLNEASMREVSSCKTIYLHGAPGVGKTALCQAAADAAGCPCIRINMNGMTNPGPIKGQLPGVKDADAGVLFNKLADVRTDHAIVILEELDHASVDVQAALLSLLDESGKFVNDYIDGVAFDLRGLVFIATGNSYNLIPALLSRFHLVEVGTYTRLQQQRILTEHLLPSASAGYAGKRIHYTKDAVPSFMEYANHAGVRELKEAVNRVVRIKVAESSGKSDIITVHKDDIARILGPAPIERGNRPGDLIPKAGVSNGLAVTGNGTGMCFAVESRLLKGCGIEVTGLPNEVVIDSVKAAITVLSADYEADFSNRKLCIQFAEGGIKKDGPSAGLSILMSVYSAVFGIPITGAVAYTGEIDLFGNVFSVGGIIEKAQGAADAGIETMFVPHDSYTHLNIDELTRLNGINIKVIPVKHVSQVIDRVFNINARKAV